MSMKSILFICKENRARSQIAEGLARYFLGHSFNIFSAGIAPAEKVHPMAVAVMAEIGIDISNQKPKNINEIPVQDIQHAFILCDHDSCPWLPAHIHKHDWPIPDPAANLNQEPGELLIKRFRKIRDELRSKIHHFLDAQNFNG
jgi:protein-tyrosine-phosphatase